jgi:hypothetical protein
MISNNKKLTFKQKLSNVLSRIVMVRLLRQTDTCNGNGHALWIIVWNLFGWNGRWWFYTEKIGNGDNGDRCEG